MDKAGNRHTRRPKFGSPWVWAGWIAGGLALLLTIATIFVLGFSTTVDGRSMEPTLHNGQKVLMNPLTKGTDAQRFDLVVLPLGPGQVRAVKRLIGLPGDQVRMSISNSAAPRVEVKPAGASAFQTVVNPTWVNAPAACCTSTGTQSAEPKAVTVPEGSVWVLGDNFPESEDSRVFGFVRQADIAAVVAFRILPIGSLGTISNSVHFAS